MTHAGYVLDWYFNFSPNSRLQSLLGSNTSYGQLLGFPVEALGIAALLCLAILAATSHDFWLAFLGPRTWKTLHYLLYPAFALVIGHVALGALQSEANPTFAIVVGASILAVCGLHFAAALKNVRTATVPLAGDGWLEVGDISEMRDGEARIVATAGGERIAVFCDGQRIAALSNACAHQNGPLGEGRVADGCVTCPWHGFQYRLADGCSPEPFTERVPTYRLRFAGTKVLVDPTPNPPGTLVEPLTIGEAAQ
jgi:nitrite reductase/ring-hydroxylating ferredoxin subunit